MTDIADTASPPLATLGEIATLHDPQAGRSLLVLREEVRPAGFFSRLADRLRDRTDEMIDETRQRIEDRPAMSILIALAVGVIGGSILRGRRYRSHW